LQSSFFTHFNLFGAVPNLVFVLFFLIVFFEKDKSRFFIFWAAIAGFFLDIFYCSYLGPSMVLLAIIAFLLKNTQLLLKNRKDSHPFIYFLPLFAVFLMFYDLALGLYLYFLDPNKIAPALGPQIIFALIYNLIVASALFYIFKKILKNFVNA